MQTETVTQLDPAKVLANPDDNAARFGVQSDTSRQEMMDSILSQGGVLQPVEVVALTGAVKGGYTHKLVYGYRRHGAVLELNKTQGAGLTLPAIVRDVDATDIVKRQIAENNDRQNMSPMDKAVAIKHLLDQGVQKPEIRRIFSTIGGKKGDQITPMSNASLNIYLNFLQLPKSIQQKIHDGTVGVSAAYLLGKVAPEQRAAVLEKAEAERTKNAEMEAKDEERFLAAEHKVTEAVQKEQEAKAAVETTAADVEAAEARVKETVARFVEVGNQIKAMSTAAGPAEVESIKAAEADKKAAEKLLKEAKAKAEKAAKEATEAAKKAKERAEQLEAARKLKGKAKAGKSKGAAVTRDDIKKADPKTGSVPITLSEFRSSLKDLQKDGVPARVSQVGALFAKLLNGELTPKLLIADLTKLLNGKEAAPKA
jgi:ParB/RepB/Spo0J family partition protein